MISLLLGAVLFGLVLSRFFRVYILIPTCGVAIILVLTGPGLINQTLTASCLQIVGLVAGLQFGYVAGLVLTQYAAGFSGRRQSWGSRAHALPSRSLHMR
jgi:hypothetical protein